MADGELPQITAMQRLDLAPGDALVVLCAASVLSAGDAERVRQWVRTSLALPDLRVLVFDSGWQVTALAAGQEPPQQWGRPV